MIYRFLQELEPPAQFDDKYAERMEELKLVNTMREKLELEYEPNFDRLMTRLKTYVSTAQFYFCCNLINSHFRLNCVRKFAQYFGYGLLGCRMLGKRSIRWKPFLCHKKYHIWYLTPSLSVSNSVRLIRTAA